MNILVLTRYGRLGASSRLRMLQYLPWLKHAGFDCEVQAFLNDEMLQTRYRSGRYGLGGLIRAYVARVWQLMQRSQFDLIWIEKEAFFWLPAWFERVLLHGVPYVLDYDDAVFHNYDLHPSVWVRLLLGRRIDRLMAGARLVVAGNRYLAQRASMAGAPWVELLPTVVDLERYPAKRYEASAARAARPCLVWIGSPSTVQYLSLLSEPLAALARQQPFSLRVIGGGPLSIPGVDVEVLPWSTKTEAAAIAECDVGIMPLLDTPWEQGKCAYKLIQYMACGLPTVASPVGANCEVVVEGETGFLTGTAEAWMDKLGLLLRDAALRQQLGAAGRKRVEAIYCLQQVAPQLVRLLQQAGGH